MSGNESTPAAASVTEGMPQADLEFLVACLQNTTGGSIAVDVAKVADVRGFKNPKSVSNKISALKKKYNLPLGSAGSPKKASDEHGPNEPAVSVTPSKARVTKPRGSSAKKPATKKTAKAKKSEEMVEDEDEAEIEVEVEVVTEDEAEPENDHEYLAVQEPEV